MEESTPKPSYTTQQASTPPPVDTYQHPNDPYTPQPKHMSKKAAIIVLLILVIIFTAGIMSTMSALLPSNKAQLAPTSAPTSSPSPTIDPMADWKTYTNDEFHLSFRYPSQFTLTEESETEKLAWYEDSEEEISVIRYDYRFSTGKLINGTPDWSGFSIFIAPTQGRNIDYIRNSQGPDGPIGITPIPHEDIIDEAADTTIGGRIYRKGNNFFQFAPFQNSNTLDDESDNVMQYYDQILTTFKFTSNQPTQPAAVTECTNEAMQCPDGSSVGRSGPNCEFVCPKSN
jgi:hypothetical protein